MNINDLFEKWVKDKGMEEGDFYYYAMKANDVKSRPISWEYAIRCTDKYLTRIYNRKKK